MLSATQREGACSAEMTAAGSAAGIDKLTAARPPGQAHLSLGLGALLLAGGVAGWVKGKSRASLAAG